MLAWIRDLETAKTVDDVLCLARDCVASLPRESLGELPEPCRKRELREAGDVLWWSERLSEEYWRRRGLGADVDPVQDAWSFFLRASIQTTRLATRERAVTARD
jgi:hypothetical protein